MDKIKEYLTFDDIALIPRAKSTINSRSEVSLEMDILGKTKLQSPILGAPMDTVCNSTMATALNLHGGVGFIHRFQSIKEQYENLTDAMNIMSMTKHQNVGVAVGVTGDYQQRLSVLVDTFNRLAVSTEDLKNVLWICFDTANGFSQLVEDAVVWFREKSGLYNPETMMIVTGNIASREAYRFSRFIGVDAVRVGIGGGSACSTSVVTGIGSGILSIISDCVFEREQYDMAEYSPLIIADGGIRTSGDAVKALAVGADLVMLGRLLSGYDESPGELIKEISYNLSNGKSKEKLLKSFRGMASKTACSTVDVINGMMRVRCPEGIETNVPYKGEVRNFLTEFDFGIKSAFSYLNSKNFEEFRDTMKGYPDTIVFQSQSSIHERLPKI